MFKTNALDSVANAYVDKDVGTGTPGTRIEANDQNIKQDELVNAVESSDQTLDSSGVFTNNDQIAKSMAIYGAGGGEYCIDTGLVNAYILNPVSPKKSIPAYFDGMKISFDPLAVNTGASTVNYAGLGVKSIVNQQGTALSGGELCCGAIIRYSSSGGNFILIGADNRNYTGARLLTTDTTLTSSDVGKAILTVRLADIALTMPAASTVKPGKAIDISTAVLAQGICTVSRQGADAIIIDGQASVTSFTMAPASDMVLVSNGADTWYAQSGVAKLKSDIGEFAHDTSTGAGYQTFPGGDTAGTRGPILQWGTGLTVAGVLAVSFPIAFPTKITSISMSGSATNVVLNYASETVSGMTVNSYTGDTAAPVATNFRYFVTGD